MRTKPLGVAIMANTNKATDHLALIGQVVQQYRTNKELPDDLASYLTKYYEGRFAVLSQKTKKMVKKQDIKAFDDLRVRDDTRSVGTLELDSPIPQAVSRGSLSEKSGVETHFKTKHY